LGSDIVQFVIISALCVASFCNRPVPTSFFFYIQANLLFFGDSNIFDNNNNLHIVSSHTLSLPSLNEPHPHRSYFKFQSATHPTFHLLFPVQLLFVFTLFLAVSFVGQKFVFCST
jgi:hypothetical protein